MGTKPVQQGDIAPDFTLPTQKGEAFHLKDLIGTAAIILYFYPKDNTAGCTAEACSFRDQYEVFKEAGAEVIGVSSDSEESHQRLRHRQPDGFHCGPMTGRGASRPGPACRGRCMRS